MKDQQLEALLSEMRKQQTTDLQIHKWKRAIRKELKPAKESYFSFKTISQIAVASIIGFLIGAAIFKNNSIQEQFDSVAKNDSENATIEYVYTNTN
jgi:hypothetical protein